MILGISVVLKPAMLGSETSLSSDCVPKNESNPEPTHKRSSVIRGDVFCCKLFEPTDSYDNCVSSAFCWLG
jgi:hypothetical protein